MTLPELLGKAFDIFWLVSVGLITVVSIILAIFG